MEAFSEAENFSNFCKVRSSCEDATVGRKGNFLHTTITFVEPEPGRAEGTAAFPVSGMLLLLECSPALLGNFKTWFTRHLFGETLHDSFPCSQPSAETQRWASLEALGCGWGEGASAAGLAVGLLV